MAKRQSVIFPGFAHQNAIPNASRIGNVMMSSVISGVDPGTRNLPADLASQVTNIFTHIRRTVEAAGGTPDDIIKITFWMKDPATARAALNDEWVKMFPDPDSRPARHTLALGAESNALVTCDVVAVFGCDQVHDGTIEALARASGTVRTGDVFHINCGPLSNIICRFV
jgi:enamine deaminase RidA (YjgF/YER057c/UK114 family)